MARKMLPNVAGVISDIAFVMLLILFATNRPLDRPLESAYFKFADYHIIYMLEPDRLLSVQRLLMDQKFNVFCGLWVTLCNVTIV